MWSSDPVLAFKKKKTSRSTGCTATLPLTTTGGTAPLVCIRKLSENVQKYRGNDGSDRDLRPYEYLTLSVNERECNAKPLDCFSKPAHDATETLEAIHQMTRCFPLEPQNTFILLLSLKVIMFMIRSIHISLKSLSCEHVALKVTVISLTCSTCVSLHLKQQDMKS